MCRIRTIHSHTWHSISAQVQHGVGGRDRHSGNGGGNGESDGVVCGDATNNKGGYKGSTKAEGNDRSERGNHHREGRGGSNGVKDSDAGSSGENGGDNREGKAGRGGRIMKACK